MSNHPNYTYLSMVKLSTSLRFLGYTRVISLESFRKPNFNLLSEILYWLCLKFDPNCEISYKINNESQRLNFMKNCLNLLSNKSRLQLDGKNLYYSDYRCIPELWKLTNLLYNACKKRDIEKTEFSLPHKFNKKNTKELAKEITEIGRNIFEKLEEEKVNNKERLESINILDNILKDYNPEEGNKIQNYVDDLIKQQDTHIEDLSSHQIELESRSEILVQKISSTETEIDNAERKLKILGNSKPPMVEEMERYEKELEKIFQIYLEKIRNIDYLEIKFDELNEIEKIKHKNMQEYLKKVQENIKNNEDNLLDDNLNNINNNQFNHKMGLIKEEDENEEY